MMDVEHLTFTYTGTDRPAVRDIGFTIERGEVFGLLGPSGAGKSTTQKVLNGLLKGYDGHVTVMGKALKGWTADYYERIGVSFEVPNHFLKLTARENLMYFRALYQGETQDPQALLELVDLGKDADMFVSQYSKGMKNRLGVARALLHNPELLFMDEPTAGLDPVNALRVKNIIRDQKEQGNTVFMTTHDMSVANELCDRVAFIIDGEIKLIDSPRALRLAYGEPTVQVEYQQNGHTERVEFPLAGLGENVSFLTVLRNHPIQTIHTQEATLEDVFIEVTGRALS